MGKRIVWLSDLDLKGSGFGNLSIPLMDGLAKRGHEIKVTAFGYKGEEHKYPFSLLPAGSIAECIAQAQNLAVLWPFDVFVVALDIPYHRDILRAMQTIKTKYIGIMPVESVPLTMTWAMYLSQMDKPFIISEFGTKEAQRVGIVDAEHLQVGIDTNAWLPADFGLKSDIRDKLRINRDEFVVLTVADNQERKNLSAAMEIFATFSKQYPNSRYVMVTRKEMNVGWRLDDLAASLGISQKMHFVERGLSFQDLWAFYAASDVFLLTSKTEGLGMPVLEAMATKLPVIGTECTGIAELLGNGRGTLISPEYISPVDPFGNSKRYWIDRPLASLALEKHYLHCKTKPDEEITKSVEDAYEYAKSRTWEHAVNQLERAIINE